MNDKRWQVYRARQQGGCRPWVAMGPPNIVSRFDSLARGFRLCGVAHGVAQKMTLKASEVREPMNELRDRIAAALKAADSRTYGDPFQVEPPSYVDLADAVIAELGLREEIRLRSYGRFLLPPVDRKQRRYVTDWEDEK